MVNTTVLGISSVLMVIMLVGAAIRRHLVQSFLGSVRLPCWLVGSGNDSQGRHSHLAAANPEYSSLAAQVATDFQAAALTLAGPAGGELPSSCG